MPIKKISIDAMGGDFGPDVTVLAAQKALKAFKDIELVLVGSRMFYRSTWTIWGCKTSHV